MRRTSLAILAFLLLGGAIAFAAEFPRYAIHWVRPLDFDRIMLPWNPVQRSAPVSGGDRIYVGTREGTAFAYDLHGNRVWSRALGGAVEADALLVGDTLYLGTVTGSVFALDAQNGDVRWRYFTGHEVLGRPAAHEDRLFVTTGNNQVYALDRNSGEWRWQYARGDDPQLSIRGAAGATVFEGDVLTGFSDGAVVRLDGATGQVEWSQRWTGEAARFTDIDSTPVILGNRVYVVVYGSRLLCMDAASGNMIWSEPVVSHEAPAVAGDRLVVGTLSGELKAFDPATGRNLWTVPVTRTWINRPIMEGSRVFFTDAAGGVGEVDGRAGTLRWRYDRAVSGFSAAPERRGAGLFALTNLGSLYRIHVP